MAVLLPLPARLARLFARMNISAANCQRADGRYSIRYGGGRVDVYPLPDGKIVLEAVVSELPADAGRSALLEKALCLSVASMRSRHDTLAEAVSRDALVLQRDIGCADSELEMEREVRGFIDAVTHWKKLLAAA